MTAQTLLRRVEADRNAAPACLLRWTFSQGDRSITCQLEADKSTSAYYVTLVPHWSEASAVAERARSPIDAFQRHAEIAMRLRALGWSLTRRSH